LSGLIQQNLVLYFAGSDRSGDASYEPNWENAYNLTIRAGTLVKLITARHGKRVGEVFDEIMVAGIARVGDIINRFADEPDKHDSPQKGSVNGDTVLNGESEEKQPHSAEDTEAAIHTLLRSGLVLPCQLRQFWPAYDLHQEAELDMKLSYYPAGCNTKRDRDECAKRVEGHLEEWRDKAFNFTRAGPGNMNGDNQNAKRLRVVEEEDDDVSTKRQKTSNGVNGTRANISSNNLLDVSLSCTQSCASRRAIAKPLPDQSRTLSQQRKMQCRITNRSILKMGSAPCRRYHVQSV
jgi:hypothetical protein